MRDLLIAALVLGGLFAAYYWRVETNKKVAELAKQAREAAYKDNVAGYKKARAYLLEALATPLPDPYVISLMAEVSVIAANELGVAEAKADYQSYLDQSEKKNARVIERYSAYGLNLLYQGKVKEAHDYLLKIIEKGGAGPKLVNALGRAQRGLGQWVEAKTAFKRAMDADWRSPRFAADQGDFLYMDNDFWNATAAYDRALQQNPEHLRSMVGKARSLIARGDRLGEADELLTAVLGREGEELIPRIRSLAVVGRAELLRALGKKAEALQAAAGAVEIDGTNPWAHHLHGLALADNTDPRAQAALQKAVELDPYVPAFYFDAALALMKAGQREAAVAQMQAYEKALPKDERYHLKYGHLLKEKGDLDGALAQYEEALKIDEFNAEGHYAKAMVLLAQKKFPAAETEFNYALQARGNYPEALRGLGDLYWEQKEIEKALEQYAQSLVKGKLMRQPKEKLDEQLAMIVDKLNKSGRREYAVSFKKEIEPLLK